MPSQMTVSTVRLLVTCAHILHLWYICAHFFLGGGREVRTYFVVTEKSLSALLSRDLPVMHPIVVRYLSTR